MAIDPAALPAASLGPVQTDTSQMDASALDAPAWGPMSAGASAVPAEPQDATAPMPDVPDFARIIPISTIEAEKMQQQAEQWGQQQQQRIADLWGHFAQQQLDQTIQRNTTLNWQPAQPTTYEPTPEPTPTPLPPTTDDKQGPRTGMEDASAAPQPNVIQQFMDGLGGLVDRMKGGVSVDQTPVDNSMPGGALGIGPHAVTSPPAMAPNAFQGGDLAADVMAPGEQSRDAMMAAPDGTGNYVNQMSGKTYTEDQHANAVAQLTSGAMSGDVAAGKAAAGAAAAIPQGFEALRAELTADHPIVQAVVNASEQAGAKVNGAAVARLIQSKGFDPENLAKATGRLTPTQTAALTAYKVAQDPEMAATLMGKTAPPAAAETLPGPEIFDKTAPASPLPETPATTDPSLENLAKAGTASEGGQLPQQNQSAWNLVSQVGTVLKQAVVAGGMMHPVTESANLLATGVATGKPAEAVQSVLTANRAFLSSKFANQLAADNAAVINEAKAAGANLMDIGSDAPDLAKNGYRIAGSLFGGAGGFAQGFISAKQQGKSNEEALGEGAVKGVAGAALVGGIAPKFNELLWGNMVPVAKLQAYKMLRSAGYDAATSAARINDTFGGQGLRKLADAPAMEKVARVTFLAPDWLASWAKNLGSIVQPGPVGGAARKFWAARAGAAVLATEGVNVALNGRPSWIGPDGKVDMGHALKTDVSKVFGQPPGSLYADLTFGGPVSGTANALIHGHPEEVLTSHLNVIPSAAYGALSNDAFPAATGHIVQPGTPPEQAAAPEAAAAVSHMAPIGISTANKAMPPAAVGTSLATGVPISPNTAVAKTGPFRSAAGTAARPGMANLRSVLTGKAPAGPFVGAKGQPSTTRGGLSKLSSALK